MSHPPDYPGRRRAKRAASSAAGDAYQGALEAVMAVLVGAGFGYWVDWRWGTTPYGVIVGVGIGFAAMVLRLLRMGRGPQPGADAGVASGSEEGAAGAPQDSPPAAGAGPEADDDRGPAEAPAESGVWRDDAADERKN